MTLSDSFTPYPPGSEGAPSWVPGPSAGEGARHAWHKLGSWSGSIGREARVSRAALAVAEEGDDLLDEVAAPPRSQEHRSPLGDRIRGHDGQPPHAVASWRASSRSLPASDPATTSLGTRGERRRVPAVTSRSAARRQTRPDVDRGSVLEGSGRRVARRDEESASAAGVISGRARSRSGSRSGSQGSSDRPWPGRSTATVSISSRRAISNGNGPQASRSAPGSCSRSATQSSCPSDIRATPPPRADPARSPQDRMANGRLRPHSVCL